LQKDLVGKIKMLIRGDAMPDFALFALAGEERIRIRSRDYLGRQNLVVTFHPLDWTPT
jgi:peroxiredoxin